MAKDLRCPFCLWPVKADEAVQDCGDCRARYHEECWAENGGCAVFGCPTWAAGQGVARPAPAPAPPPPPAPVPMAPAPTAAGAATATRLPGVAAPTHSFCDQCGGRVGPTDRFCGSCGNTIS